MRRLIWGFAGCTYHIVGNLMSRLICSAPFWSLRTILGISHAHHSCGEKRWKLSGSRLSDHLQIQIDTVFRNAYVRWIFPHHCGQNKVTKTCPKYLLTHYYKWSSQFQILINRSGEIKQYTKFPVPRHPIKVTLHPQDNFSWVPNCSLGPPGWETKVS